MAIQSSSGTGTREVRQVEHTGSRRRRTFEATALVAVWMTAGWLLPIDSNGYLLLGIPLTVVFQVLVRRRPLRELYAAQPVRAALDTRGKVMAAGLAVVPGWQAVRAVMVGEWTLFGWYLAAVIGAICAAYSLRAISVRAMLRSAALPLAVGSGGFAIAFGLAHIVTGRPLPVLAAVFALAKYSTLYFPASFLLEEVTFRGALDDHLRDRSERNGWQSAILVSALWGLWHLPVSSTRLPWFLQMLQLLAVHVLFGVPLSFAWRRTHNLAGPALAHAVNDAVRNAFLIGL